VIGVRVLDQISGDRFDVRGKVVINTTGPWINDVFSRAGHHHRKSNSLAKAVNLIVKPIFTGYAVGLMGQNNLNDQDVLVEKGSSFLFIAPWRGKSILGTTYTPFTGNPDEHRPDRKDVRKLLDTFNKSYPAANLAESDVSFVHSGLLPASSLNLENNTVNLAKHPMVYDHREEGLAGLVSVAGVKYTTARQVAKQTLEKVLDSWGIERKGSHTDSVALYGGRIEDFESFQKTLLGQQPCGLGEKSIQNLVYNYGSEYFRVLDEVDPAWQSLGLSEEQALIRAEVRHAIKREMAYKLSDVVLRRTELGTAERPNNDLLKEASTEMAVSFGWSMEREHSELKEIDEIYNTID
jgi:glycerol-3-phosphate dehydrogenase